MPTVYALNGEPFTRRGNDLYRASTGEHIGTFQGNEVYAPSGRYLGELTHTGRLGTRTSNRSRLGGVSAQKAQIGAVGLGWSGQAGMPAGFEDFIATDE